MCRLSSPELHTYGRKVKVSHFSKKGLSKYFTYQMHAITALLSTGHNEPQIPKLERQTTGNAMWYLAAIRPVRQTKKAAIAYPIQTVSQDCHHDMPATMLELAIIHVLILNESD